MCLLNMSVIKMHKSICVKGPNVASNVHFFHRHQYSIFSRDNYHLIHQIKNSNRHNKDKKFRGKRNAKNYNFS